MAKTESTMNRAKTDETTLDDVRNDIRALKTDIGGYISHNAERGVETVRHGAEAALDASKRAADGVAAAHRGACRYVSEHPAASVLVAFGVGAIVSRLLPRR